MKSTTKLQLSVLALSIFAVIALFAYFSFAIPLWAINTNSTAPASATYNPSANYSFQINFTEPSGNMANASFQLDETIL